MVVSGSALVLPDTTATTMKEQPMTSTKRTAKQPEDLKVGAALDEVETESKVAGNPKRAAADAAAARAVGNSTFASRSKTQGKRVGSATNKAITADESDAK